MRTPAIAAALFGFGLAVNLFYGRRGFMPLDQGIVFDGAWRLWSGQVPFRDFLAPNAIVPSAMQVPFFAVFGVSWFAFVLHASVINGLFCALAYAILRLCGAPRLEAAAYGALSAFYFYPPNGTPFMDQHAFFFSALLFAVVLLGSAGERSAWFFVPILFAVGFLSKQIPTAFAALCIAAWIAVNPRRIAGWLAPLAAGTFTVVLLVLALALLLRFSLRDAVTSLIVMPLGVGTERTTGSGFIAPIRLILGTIRRLPGWSNQWTMYAVPVAIIARVATLRSRRGSPKGLRHEWQDERWWLDVWLLASLFFMTGAFIAYTINQIEDGFSLLMLMAGLSSLFLRRAAQSIDWRWRRELGCALTAVIAFAAVRDTVVFARTVDSTRSVLDTVYDPALADRAARVLPPALGFMRWTHINCEPEEFAELVRVLRAGGNFALISDLGPLYALAGKPSVMPALWLHPGLSIPLPNTAAFGRFDGELLERMQTFGVRRLVLDEPHTLRGVTLGDFPKLYALVLSRGCGEQYFGGVRVIDLCGP
jgi:hypothetical protein